MMSINYVTSRDNGLKKIKKGGVLQKSTWFLGGVIQKSTMVHKGGGSNMSKNRSTWFKDAPLDQEIWFVCTNNSQCSWKCKLHQIVFPKFNRIFFCEILWWNKANMHFLQRTTSALNNAMYVKCKNWQSNSLGSNYVLTP